MAEINKLLNDTEKQIYVQALAYILTFSTESSAAVKNDYLKAQAKDAGISESVLKKTKAGYKADNLISDLNSIKDIRIKRYILREMILLAIADHEVLDSEIEAIYKIACKIGIKSEKVNDFFMWAAKGLEWQIEGTQLVEEDL